MILHNRTPDSRRTKRMQRERAASLLRKKAAQRKTDPDNHHPHLSKAPKLGRGEIIDRPRHSTVRNDPKRSSARLIRRSHHNKKRTGFGHITSFRRFGSIACKGSCCNHRVKQNDPIGLAA